MIDTNELLNFIQKLDPEDSSPVGVNESLFKSRRLNSITIMQLIAFIETKVGRKLREEEIVLDNFDTIEAIVETFHG